MFIVSRDGKWNLFCISFGAPRGLEMLEQCYTSAFTA